MRQKHIIFPFFKYDLNAFYFKALAFAAVVAKLDCRLLQKILTVTTDYLDWNYFDVFKCLDGASHRLCGLRVVCYFYRHIPESTFAEQHSYQPIIIPHCDTIRRLWLVDKYFVTQATKDIDPGASHWPCLHLVLRCDILFHLFCPTTSVLISSSRGSMAW